MPFSKLGLSDQLVQGVLATGYTAPTAIQSRAIPLAVAGRDVIGCAKTGTGKTAAFVLPMLHRLTGGNSHPSVRRVRGLVLTPTRELAQQVEESVTGYGRFTALRSLSVFGGVSMENQVKRLRRGVDIVVATPGRLLDHVQRRTIDLSHVEILVLDEADRMFDMGFINDVRSILARVPAKRQTLLFSATMSKEVTALTASVQEDPELIEIGEQRRPVETIRQYFYGVQQEAKLGLLLHILRTQSMDSVLVFTRTKHGADKISHRLERGGQKSVAIHSNRTQAQRQRALDGFKRGSYKVLVATDIASRGIDVEGISHVVNYDTPVFAEDYIHRIGRTGRAASTGDAITFVSRQERQYLKNIEYYVGKGYNVKEYPGFDQTQEQLDPPAGGRNQERTRKQHEPRIAAAHQRPAGKKWKRPSQHPRARQAAKDDRTVTLSSSSQDHDWRNHAAVGEERSGLRMKVRRFFKRK